jgi:excisionase family DNA binding protein
MAAYDMSQLEPSARLPQPHSARWSDTWRQQRETAAAPTGFNHAAIDETSIIEAVVDRLADRLAAAVIARLATDSHQRDEWFDSRRAAEYLGLHRDTLRRLAAARTIPSEQDGRGCKLFFRRAALDEWRRSGGRARHLSAVTDASRGV